MSAANYPNAWPLLRREQLEKLDKLLRLVQALNRGSSFIENVEQAIALAEELTYSDLRASNYSFLSFLRDECLGQVVAKLAKERGELAKERDELATSLREVVRCLSWHAVEQGRGVAMDAKALSDARDLLAEAGAA